MAESDIEALRAVGLDDRAVHDATGVVAYFNYINRVADALDVDLEAEMPPHPRADAKASDEGGERAAPR
ncbi:MAG: hypothetical protein JNN27_04560 [Planctomycetes bacterium]|nr:hypothetical protein [Planctomycetota bacterium]